MFGRVFVLAVAVFGGASCSGSGGSSAAPRTPSSVQSSWVASVLGSPADLSLFVRPTGARTDPYWGPVISRVLSGSDHSGDFISHGSGTMVLNARQIDMHFAIRDPLHLNKSSKDDPRSIGWVGVIHGIVPLDPVGLRSGNGQPLFAPPFRLPSGVSVYPPEQSYARQFGLFAPTLFITPDGTCIVTEQVSAPHAQQVLAGNPAPPPALEAASDSLVGVTFGVTSVRFLNAGKNDQTSLTQGMLAAGFGLHGGTAGAIDGYADYATSDDATRGYAALQRTCAEKTDACVLQPGLFRNAEADRDGGRITVRLAFSEATLKTLRDWTP